MFLGATNAHLIPLRTLDSGSQRRKKQPQVLQKEEDERAGCVEICHIKEEWSLVERRMVVRNAHGWWGNYPVL